MKIWHKLKFWDNSIPGNYECTISFWSLKKHAHICKILKLTEMVSQVLKDPELFFKKQNENYKMSENSKFIATVYCILLPQYCILSKLKGCTTPKCYVLFLTLSVPKK